MTIENDIYTTEKELRDDYPLFSFALSSYLKNLDHHWHLTKCYDQDCDGSRFSVICKDGWGNELSITATKDNGQYYFEIFKTIINDKL